MDFGQIKEITLEEAQKILSKDIAYITMKDGEVLVVNGLDHDKFDKREKEKKAMTNFPTVFLTVRHYKNISKPHACKYGALNKLLPV